MTSRWFGISVELVVCGGWVGGQRHDATALSPRERVGTHFTGGWVCPRARL